MRANINCLTPLVTGSPHAARVIYWTLAGIARICVAAGTFEHMIMILTHDACLSIKA